MSDRLRLWTWAFLISIDQLAHVLLTFFTYVLCGRGPCPNPDETISSRVGRAALRKRRWALACERGINWLFERLGDDPDHCRRSVERTGGS